MTGAWLRVPVMNVAVESGIDKGWDPVPARIPACRLSGLMPRSWSGGTTSMRLPRPATIGRPGRGGWTLIYGVGRPRMLVGAVAHRLADRGRW